MSWGWIILIAIGGLIGGVLLFFVLIPAIGDIIKQERHARAWRKQHGHRMSETLYPDKLKTLTDRATPPYLDPENYGSERHYIYALAAPMNTKRVQFEGYVGGFHDQLKYYDATKGPVLASDIKTLKDGMAFESVKDRESLRNALMSNMNGPMWSETAQSFHLAGHTKTPDDPEVPDQKRDKFHENIDMFLTRQRGEHRKPLDLRTWRLLQTVHIARAGATLGWIDEDEAGRTIDACAVELMARVCRYDSWDAYAKMFIACETHMRATGNERRVKTLQTAVDDLLKQPYSPWNLLSFHHTEAQKSFAKVVPAHNPVMIAYTPKDFAAMFPEGVAGDWLAEADRAMADPSGEVAEQLRNDDLLKHLDVDTMKALLADHPKNPGVLLLGAIYYFLLGYAARGNDTANNVSNDQFTALDHCCAISVRYAADGNALAPEHPAFVAAMLDALPHVYSEDLREYAARAHELAETVFIDNFICQWAIAQHRLEKWGGRTFEAFDFARERMARSDNPEMNLLFIFAAVEFVENPFICGGNHDLWLERLNKKDLIKDTKAAIDALLPHLEKGISAANAQSYILWWAYYQHDLPLIYKLGPDLRYDRFHLAAWKYRTGLNVHYILTWLKDVAIAGDPNWKEANAAAIPDIVH